MRIAFDVSPLVRPHPPGVVRAVRGMLVALERRAKIEVVRMEPVANESLRTWRFLRLERRAREAECVGIHSSVSALPIAHELATVQTIYELPWRHGVRENADLRHRLWASIGPRMARRVIVTSRFVERDLAAENPSSREKLRVVPLGVGAPFGATKDPLDEQRVARFGVGSRPFALCVGAVRAKKNLEAVLGGLAALGRDRPALLVTGPRTDELERDLETAREFGLESDISAIGAVSDLELAALYRRAAFVPVLSHSEGFAFPVLEALASGTPAVVSANSAQAELGGEVAIRVDAANARSIAAGFERALVERAERRDAALLRAAEFDWSRTAERVEELWSEIG